MILHVPEHQQLLTTVWLPAQSHRGIKEIRFLRTAWLALLVCTLFKGKELFQLAVPCKDLTNTSSSGVEVQGDKLRWKTSEKKSWERQFQFTHIFPVKQVFFRWPSATHKTVVCLCVYLGGEWKMIYLIYQGADDSQKMVTNPLHWTQKSPVKHQPM